MYCGRCFLPKPNEPCKHCADWDARAPDAGYDGLKQRFVRMLGHRGANATGSTVCSC